MPLADSMRIQQGQLLHAGSGTAAWQGSYSNCPVHCALAQLLSDSTAPAARPASPGKGVHHTRILPQRTQRTKQVKRRTDSGLVVSV